MSYYFDNNTAGRKSSVESTGIYRGVSASMIAYLFRSRDLAGHGQNQLLAGSILGLVRGVFDAVANWLVDAVIPDAQVVSNHCAK